MAENVMYMLCYVLQDMTKIYYVFLNIPINPFIRTQQFT
jgi:hypothetical protein